MPGPQVQRGRREQDGLTAISEGISGCKYAKWDHQNLDRHLLPQSAVSHGTVCGPEMKLAKEDVRGGELSIPAVVKDETQDDKDDAAAGTDQPEVARRGDEPYPLLAARSQD